MITQQQEQLDALVDALARETREYVDRRLAEQALEDSVGRFVQRAIAPLRSEIASLKEQLAAKPDAAAAAGLLRRSPPRLRVANG